jgi:hypothetical protein
MVYDLVLLLIEKIHPSRKEHMRASLIRLLNAIKTFRNRPRLTSEEYEVRYFDRRAKQHRYGNIVG